MTRHRVVFLLDVDNTLLDNDRVTADLKRYLIQEVGAERQERYWTIFETLRTELGYADYLGALQRYRIEHPRDPKSAPPVVLPRQLPVREPALPGIARRDRAPAQWGPPVIFSDGDVVFQPRKVERSGLFDAVEHRALIYIHKELELDDVERRYRCGPLRARRRQGADTDGGQGGLGRALTTVFPRQGHYAHDPSVATYPPPDVTIERIGDLLDYGLPALLEASRSAGRT